MFNINKKNITESVDGQCRQKGFLRYAVAIMMAIAITAYLYWPIYRTVRLNDVNSNIDSEVSRLDLPINEEIKEILDRKIDLPRNRHELCLKNMNGFHFIHADSNTLGVPFHFYTNDLNLEDFGHKNKLGAMAIYLFFQDGLLRDEIYSEFGQPRKCIILDNQKLKRFASSTVEYSFIGLNRLEELPVGSGEKLWLQRPIVGGYSVDTTKSSLYIVARWNFLVLTFIALLVLCFFLSKYVVQCLIRSCSFFEKFYIKIVCIQK